MGADSPRVDSSTHSCRVLITGGRDFTNLALIWTTLSRYHQERNFTDLMQGGAAGADALASEWAVINNVQRWVCKADWTKYGNAAGPIRNTRMLEWKPDLVLAFPTLKSIGTWDMIRKARDAKIETVVFEC